LSAIAFSAITIERNVIRSSTKAKIRTNPNTIGALLFNSEFWSTGWAVVPVTAKVASGTFPIVAGRMSLRSVFRASFDVASTPL
jgi:hypothetical protein